jgi:hypothetical protein
MLLFRASALLTRLTRWEFWPSWLVYIPLIPYIACLALRHRSLFVCMRANPGIPYGGIVGESKWGILRLLPREWIVPTMLLAPGPLDDRLNTLRHTMDTRQWSWPIILKPDVGERGRGVAIIPDLGAARAYLRDEPRAVLAQRRHPGPYEAGVFYYRFPDEPRGRILSVTDKRFASVDGDGVSSLRTLIWRHPRYRVQARSFLDALGEKAGTIPVKGQVVTIGAIGNHCRGTMFLDGASLATPALEAAIDSLATRTPGFYFGRFDVRYSDASEFAAGRGFEIVELNGLLSESTNIYDPGTTFWKAQRILREQWRLAFAIGAKAASRG